MFVLTRKHLLEKKHKGKKKKKKEKSEWCAELWLGDLDQLKTGREEEQEDINTATGQYVRWPVKIKNKNIIFKFYFRLK